MSSVAKSGSSSVKIEIQSDLWPAGGEGIVRLDIEQGRFEQVVRESRKSAAGGELRGGHRYACRPSVIRSRMGSGPKAANNGDKTLVFLSVPRKATYRSAFASQ